MIEYHRQDEEEFELPSPRLEYMARPSLAWQQAFALFGSMVVGATAWERMMQQNPPEPPGGQ